MRLPRFVLLCVVVSVPSAAQEEAVPLPSSSGGRRQARQDNGGEAASPGNNSAEGGEFAKRGFGEPCTCDSDCDLGRWLICSNGYCSCARNSFLYDYNRQTCVVRLGEKCFEIAQEYIEYNPKDLPPSIRCIEGAFCSMSAGGVCACNTYTHYSSLDGTTCQRKKSYGQPCTKGPECKSDVCSGADGKCICNIGEFYHKRRKRCVSLVGAICFTDEDCLDNGICLEHLAVCGCSSGFLESSSKTCERRLNFNDPCSEGNPCNNPHLSCIDSKCSCRYSSHQRFDNETNLCVSFPGGPCVDDSSCAPHSKCVQVQSGGITFAGFQECQCEAEFLEMQDGSCKKFSRQGEHCELSSECDPVAADLACIYSRCECKDALTRYDTVSRKCLGVVGARCAEGGVGCIANALCIQPNAKLAGRCQCVEGFVVGRDRTCVLL